MVTPCKRSESRVSYLDDFISPRSILTSRSRQQQRTAKLMNEANKIIQQQTLQRYSKQWATNELQLLLSDFEIKNKKVDVFIPTNQVENNRYKTTLNLN